MKPQSISIYVIGKPDVKKLPKVEAKLFYKELLDLIIKYKHEVIEKNKSS